MRLPTPAGHRPSSASRPKRPASIRRCRVATTCGCSPALAGLGRRRGTCGHRRARRTARPHRAARPAGEGAVRRRTATSAHGHRFSRSSGARAPRRANRGRRCPDPRPTLGVVRNLAHDGAAVVYSTHYFPEVAELEASVAILERGRVLARGTINDVVARARRRRGRTGVRRTRPRRSPDCPRRRGDHHRITRADRNQRPRSRHRLGPRRPRHPRRQTSRGLTVSQPSLETAFLQLTDDPRTSPTETHRCRVDEPPRSSAMSSASSPATHCPS